MANGSDNLKAEADYIADDIDNDGVAKAMEVTLIMNFN